MSRVQILRLLVPQRLTAAAEEILGLFETTIEENEEEYRGSQGDRRQRVGLDDAISGSAPSVKMSQRLQMLRVLVKQRLTAAVEETFALIEKTIIEYEEEIGRQRRTEDAVKSGIHSNDADSPQLLVLKVELDQQDPNILHIKEEPKQFWTTQQEEEQVLQLYEADIANFPFTPGPVKSEDEEKHQSLQHSLPQTEESRETEPLASTSTEQVKTESDGDCGVSEPTSNLALASDAQPTSDGHLSVKSEDEEKPQSLQHSLPQTEESRETEPLASTSTERVKTESDGDCGVSEPTSNLAPASDVQPTSDGLLSSDYSETEDYDDDDDDWNETSEAQSCSATPKNKASRVSRRREGTRKKTFSCTVCGKVFTVNGNLKIHMRLHSGEKTFSCSVCGKAFHQKGNMQVHMRSHTGDRPYSCSVCGKSFGYRASLHRHKTTHVEEKPFHCTVCGKRFGLKERMNEHMMIHTGEKPFSCSVCGKQFNQRGAVNMHMRSHTRDRSFSCSVCDKSFGYKASLQKHMTSHTEEKPFHCTVCGKSYGLKERLKTHMMLHTGEKPFSCSVCGKQFSQRGAVNSHMMTHSGDRPFSCSVCFKSFGYKGSLQRHMTIHTGDKPFHWTVCGKGFSAKGNLMARTRIHTQEKEHSSF